MSIQICKFTEFLFFTYQLLANDIMLYIISLRSTASFKFIGFCYQSYKHNISSFYFLKVNQYNALRLLSIFFIKLEKIEKTV